MNKSSFKLLFLLVALLLGALYFNKSIQTPFVTAINSIKENYLLGVEYLQDKIDEHINQKDMIISLKEKLKDYKMQHLISHQLSSEINDLFTLESSSLKSNPKVDLARVISYARFGDHNKFWLEFGDYNSSKIYGLVHNNYAAGIVIEKNGKPLALLNADPKNSYAVYVGEDLAPGIVKGLNSDRLSVEFIPAWIKIKEGDEVITSGLDQMFFKGLKVGKVISIDKFQGYQHAIIDPYFKSIKTKYFHVIKEVD